MKRSLFIAAALIGSLFSSQEVASQSAPFNSNSIATLGGNCGVASAVPYQDTNGVTKCGVAGTNGQFLTLQAGIPTWVNGTPGSGVTSVGMDLPSIFSVTGSPVTAAGTLTAALASQAANLVLASPNGSSGVPTFRAVDAADIGTGTLPVARGGTGVTTSTGTGNNVLSNTPTLGTTINISDVAGVNKTVSLQTGGVNRWFMRTINPSETGSNAGTDLEFSRRADDGTSLGTPLFIRRSNGQVGIGTTAPTEPLTVSGNTRITGNMTALGNIVNDALPNLSKSVQGTGVPGIDGGHWMLWNNQTGATFDPVPTLRIDRNMSPSVVAGTPANTYQAVKINGTAGVNNQGYEWPLTVELHNYSLASLQSQNVAINGTAWLEANGVGETGKTWGANFNVSDKTTMVDPTAGRVALELDNYAHPNGSTDANRARVGLQIALGTFDGSNPDAGTPLHMGRGILIGANQPNMVLDRLMEVSGSGTYDIGIDTTAATFAKPVIFMKEGQRIGLDGNTAGAYTRSLRYDSGSLAYQTNLATALTVGDAGKITAGYSGGSGVMLSLQNSSGTCTHTPGSSSETVSCTSDERLKSDITETAIDAVKSLEKFHVKDFTWKATGERKTGVIAQEVEKTNPEMVSKDKDGFLSVAEINSWVLVKAIQEQQEEIDFLKYWLYALSAVITLLVANNFRSNRR